MRLIDERGRLFGRMNVFDAALLAGVVATIALAIVGYRLLKVPLPPRVIEVSPNTFTAGPSLRMTVKGENLLPYMHVYLQRTGQPTKLMHDPLRWIKMDSYTPVNGARTAFRLESPTLGEVETIDELLPGAYDMIFHDETKVVGVAQAAFSVLPAPKLKVESKYRETVLRVSGVFVGMNRADAGNVKAGSGIPSGAEESWGEVVSTGQPRRDVAGVDTGAGVIDAPILDRWQVPADLRLRCVATRGRCFSMEMLLAVGETLKVQVAGATRDFVIQKVSLDSPASAR